MSHLWGCLVGKGKAGEAGGHGEHLAGQAAVAEALPQITVAVAAGLPLGCGTHLGLGPRIEENDLGLVDDVSLQGGMLRVTSASK